MSSTSQPLRVLTVEDDSAIRRGIVDALRFAGYSPLEAANGETGLAMALQRPYDLLLLDLVLPGRDGLEILRQVRTVRPTQPVIILTARGAESDRVTGLQLGADDYVIKPFSIKELLARIEAVLRRSPERPRDIAQIPFPGGVADLARSEIRFDDGQRVELSEKEVELLRYLAANAGRAISRDELLLRSLADQPAWLGHADDRHARHAAARKASRRSVRAAGRAHRPRQGLYVRRDNEGEWLIGE